MGTFHNDKGELHGITVVVDTIGPKVWIGRCDEVNDSEVILVDADAHEDGANGTSKADYVVRAAKYGIWKKHSHVRVPRHEVTSIKRLGELMNLPLPQRKAPLPPEVVNPKADAAPTTDTLVTLTANAQKEVRRLVAAESKPGTGLRLGVKGGGCSGLSYKLEFDQKREGDFVIPYDGFNVYLDRKSTIYLRGITLDHQQGLAGKGFVFHNPNATNTCGCGESFSV